MQWVNGVVGISGPYSVEETDPQRSVGDAEKLGSFGWGLSQLSESSTPFSGEHDPVEKGSTAVYSMEGELMGIAAQLFCGKRIYTKLRTCHLSIASTPSPPK